MQYRSILASAALFFSQTCMAFDEPAMNVRLQTNQYEQNYLIPTENIIQEDVITTYLLNEKEKQRRYPAELPRYLYTSPTEDWEYLKGQTYTVLGISVATVALMTLLPESVTNWTAEDRDFSNLTGKWWDNVSDGPVWDRDDHYLNYLMHPYFGGVYYTAARHAGYGQFESFLYSAVLSTFFWEYGVESFAEVPSWQDIIVTPLFGAAVGELMYITEQNILAEGGEVWGSEALGDVSLFFLNPIGHIHYWITGIWDDDATSVSLTANPFEYSKSASTLTQDTKIQNIDQDFIGMKFRMTF